MIVQYLCVLIYSLEARLCTVQLTDIAEGKQTSSHVVNFGGENKSTAKGELNIIHSTAVDGLQHVVGGREERTAVSQALQFIAINVLIRVRLVHALYGKGCFLNTINAETEANVK